MKARVIWTLAVMVVLSIVAVFTYRRRENPPPKFRDLSGGAAIQRQRIGRSIETTGRLNVEEAIASLSQYNVTYELAGLSKMTPSSPGICFMNSMLADRRISKIYSHLSLLPVTVADAKAQKIFENHFAIFVNEWRTFAKNGGVFPNTGPPHHAASAGLFLCSLFRSIKTSDFNIQRWDDTLRQAEFEQIKLVQMFEPSRLIVRVFHLNLIVLSGHRHRRSVIQLNQELQKLCQKISGNNVPFLQITKMRVFKWNAETLDTDFTHRTRGIPASSNAVLLELPGFADPNAWLRLENPDVVEQFVNCIRTWRDR
jgi:hypothetical protein